ncbi:hypothetical protein GJ744_009967 [Endocarpon pusillum]|uniref:Uncharacterized protein n=1 Tax=Endocarpon pusillum TaxID=364733 RepID=A0A8H7AF39_9EURO|nr:hypothetical protein GJ744_009967 [Endocarpon pusillum]
MSTLIPSAGDLLARRASSNSIIQQLSVQWRVPADVLSILLLIGGDIVQKALAQTSGGVFTPVCFSFGWVSYSLMALVGLIGDGRLLPAPDYPAKVVNLQSGYARENRNWVIGRLLRDNGIVMSRKAPLENKAIRIAVYAAQPIGNRPLRTPFGTVGVIGILVMIAQLLIAAVPFIRDQSWEILVLTGAGTFLVQSTGALPQWRAEKLPQRQQSGKDIALTSGNGSRDIMVIRGCGNCIDLEELAAAETPRSNRVWENIHWLSKPIMENGEPRLHSNGTPARQVFTLWGIPVGFWLTLITISVQCILWLALLISVAGLRSHTWYLLGVGLLGMFQNATVAAISRGPERRCLPLKLADTIITTRVMDGLMDLETVCPSFGTPLLKEFFPGKLRDEEGAWWAGNRKEYDEKRAKEKSRGLPRGMMPKYINPTVSLASLFNPNSSKSMSFGSDSLPPVPNTSRPQSPFDQYPADIKSSSEPPFRSKSPVSQASTVDPSLPGRSISLSSEKQPLGRSPLFPFSSNQQQRQPRQQHREVLGVRSDSSGILRSSGVAEQDFSKARWSIPTGDAARVNETDRASSSFSVEGLSSIAQSPDWA